MRKDTIIGAYRVLYWNALDPETGISGWVVFPASGSACDTISKHTSRADAVAAAKRYDAGDKRRSSAA